MTEIPQAALRARQMYAEGAPTRRILAETKLSPHALYRWLDGRAGKRGPQLVPALPRRKIARKSPNLARFSPGDRLSLIERMMRSSERQIAEIEKRIGTDNDKGEKDARTLALIARTVRELTAIDAINRGLGQQEPADHGDEDRPPDDIDEFRAELTRRIHSIVASRRPAGVPGDDPA